MRIRNRESNAGLIVAALSAAAWMAPRSAESQELEPPAVDATADVELKGGAEVLTRGPVHEAFADPYAQSPENALVVEREPPEPIDEVPPDVMPDGEDVQWIPGYWGWDDERSDFIWISGVWRDLPPGQQWVPGAWSSVSGGFGWTPGFWTSADVEEVTYLPEPPPSQEAGANSPAPDDNHFWVPGVWQYANNDYSWRPGYWAPAYQDWVWVPDRNVWTPYGYVHCAGFWDYALPNRGMLYSPVYFPGYQYSGFVPRQVVAVGPLLIHLFVRPGYGHYYFGDYYGDTYAQFGIVPWLGVNQFAYYQYDPLFAFYQTGYFNGRDGFLGRIAGWHNYYDRHPDFRPRRTLAETRNFLRQRGDADENILQQASLTRPIEEVRRSKTEQVALREVAAADRERIGRRSAELRDLQKARRDEGNRRSRGERAEGGLKLPKVERERPIADVPQRPDRELRRQQRSRPELDGPRETPGRDRNDGRDAAPDRGERRERLPDRRQPADRPSVDPPQRESIPPDGGRNQRERRIEPDRRQNPQSELRRRGRGDMQLPNLPDGAGREVRPIPRPSEPIPQRGEQRETRRPVAPREQQSPGGASQRDRRPVNPPSSGSELRGRGRSDSGPSRQLEAPRSQPQPQPDRGSRGSDRKGRRDQ